MAEGQQAAEAARAEAATAAERLKLEAAEAKCQGTPQVGGADAAQGPSFRTAMADALQNISGQQQQADRLQRELTLDNPNVSVEQTVMAMQKAQIGFQAALQVRNRLAQAYSDIMNMQV